MEPARQPCGARWLTGRSLWEQKPRFSLPQTTKGVNLLPHWTGWGHSWLVAAPLCPHASYPPVYKLNCKHQIVEPAESAPTEEGETERLND